jgi:RNA polymerase sigma-70 factor (ECF subfamily)
MPAEDERSLHRAVLAGDERAWRAWYDASFPGLDNYVLWRCGGLRDVADDIVQETWLTAVRRIRDFDPQRGRFLAWLRGIAANLLREYFRRRAHEPLASDDHAASVSTELEQRDQAEQIARALGRLSQRHEAVLRAKYLDLLSVEAIAREWGETAKAIESLLGRAREAFRVAYSQSNPEETGVES